MSHWADVARQLVNNRHLEAFLRANPANLRRQMYELLKPHLSFKAKPYFLLNA